MLFLNLARVFNKRSGTRFVEDFLSSADILATVAADKKQQRWAFRELMIKIGHKDWTLVRTRKGFAAVGKEALKWAFQRRDEEKRMKQAHMW